MEMTFSEVSALEDTMLSDEQRRKDKAEGMGSVECPAGSHIAMRMSIERVERADEHVGVKCRSAAMSSTGRFQILMTESELRAKIRELMTSGALPSAPHVIERVGAAALDGKARVVLHNPQLEPCSICDEPGPQIAYFWPGGVVVRVHATCRAVWQQERTR